MEELIIEIARKHGLLVKSTSHADGELIIASKEHFIDCIKDILSRQSPVSHGFTENEIVGGL